MTKTSVVSGRPLKDPIERVGIPARALFTPRIIGLMLKIAEQHDIQMPQSGAVPSDIVRLGIFNLLRKHDMINEEVYNDPSWNTLKEKGLV